MIASLVLNALASEINNSRAVFTVQAILIIAGSLAMILSVNLFCLSSMSLFNNSVSDFDHRLFIQIG
jgi:hypothetical protein